MNQFNPLRFVEVRVEIKSKHDQIAEIAYFRAERRGFEPGHESEDWMAAEAELARIVSPDRDDRDLSSPG